MDVLSEVLQAVRLSGAVYFEVDATHPWISTSPSMTRIGASMMPGADHVIPFHIMVRGQAWAMPEDRTLGPESVTSGDVIMFPFGEGHVLTSDRAAWEGPPPDVQFYHDTAQSEAPFTLVRIGGGGEKAKFVCGYLGCDASPFNPLLDALPRMLIVKEQMNGSGLMQELLRAALSEEERNKAGASTVLAKLSELMFVQAIRRHLESLPRDATTWLAGLREQHVGKALRLIHQRPAEDWSLERLARESGLSRSVFAERFARYAGEPPMHYVGRWRMQLAAKLLAGGASIGGAAEQVGYSSEAAFQRAFKKYVGATPGQWRKRSHAAEA